MKNKSVIRSFVRTTFFVFAVFLLQASGFATQARPQAQTQGFALESVLSSPFPSSLTVSPKGDLVAWTFDHQGKRNIWVAKGPNFQAREITHFDQDDGLEITEVSFNYDGSVIVFVRNQEANRAGEYPNPTSDPQGSEQSVWAVKVEGGEPWRIGEGNSLVASPAENTVVYLLRGKIFVASLDGAPKLQMLFRARGNSGSPSFSPDGTKLAFSSSRTDHAFIGIYDMKRKSILWVSPSVDRDMYPLFSPDGKQAAFFRFPDASGAAAYSEGQSLAIMVADAATGQAREVWRLPNETGGFAQSYPANPLMWAAGGRLLFYSEHEGWMHMYSLNPADGKAVCLTPGEFEIEDSCLTPDLGTLIFNSNQGDVDRRHLWAVPVAGGTPKILTPGKGLEWSPAVPSSSGAVVYLCSTHQQPAAPAVIGLQGSGQRPIAPDLVPASFPLKDLVEPQPVIIKSLDGLEIHNQLFLPKGAKAGDKRPAVIFMHGGPIRQMMLGWQMRYYYHNAYGFNQYLASKGYVVLSVNFRAGIGYGRAFRMAAGRGAQGASEYQDIVAAGKYLQNRPEVDPNKIGLWGGSYGGYLTALGLARDSQLFAAGVDLHGVHDWSARMGGRASGGTQENEAMRVAFDSSPVADLSFWSSPVLFIHGDDDRNVDFNQTTDLVQRLRKIGRVHLELLIFPDEVHDFLRHENWLKAYRAAADFFDRFLKK